LATSCKVALISTSSAMARLRTSMGSSQQNYQKSAEMTFLFQRTKISLNYFSYFSTDQMWSYGNLSKWTKLIRIRWLIWWSRLQSLQFSLPASSAKCGFIFLLFLRTELKFIQCVLLAIIHVVNLMRWVNYILMLWDSF